MSMVDRVCVQCNRGYSFYQHRNIVKDCPYCGAKGGYLKPMTAEEANNAMGIYFDDKTGEQIFN